MKQIFVLKKSVYFILFFYFNFAFMAIFIFGKMPFFKLIEFCEHSTKCTSSKWHKKELFFFDIKMQKINTTKTCYAFLRAFKHWLASSSSSSSTKELGAACSFYAVWGKCCMQHNSHWKCTICGLFWLNRIKVPIIWGNNFKRNLILWKGFLFTSF